MTDGRHAASGDVSLELHRAVAELLTDPGERARQLRQTSPFAGALDPRTRWTIWRRVRAARGPR